MPCFVLQLHQYKTCVDAFVGIESEDCVLVALSTMLGVNLDLGFICSQGRQQVGLSSFHFSSEISIDNHLRST